MNLVLAIDQILFAPANKLENMHIFLVFVFEILRAVFHETLIKIYVLRCIVRVLYMVTVAVCH